MAKEKAFSAVRAISWIINVRQTWQRATLLWSEVFVA